MFLHKKIQHHIDVDSLKVNLQIQYRINLKITSLFPKARQIDYTVHLAEQPSQNC